MPVTADDVGVAEKGEVFGESEFSTRAELSIADVPAVSGEDNAVSLPIVPAD